jgi:hypothetical protein
MFITRTLLLISLLQTDLFAASILSLVADVHLFTMFSIPRQFERWSFTFTNFTVPFLHTDLCTSAIFDVTGVNFNTLCLSNQLETFLATTMEQFGSVLDTILLTPSFVLPVAWVHESTVLAVSVQLVVLITSTLDIVTLLDADL